MQPIEGGSQPPECPGDPHFADRASAHRGHAVDQQVGVCCVGPVGASVAQPVRQRSVGEVVQWSGSAGDGQPTVTEVDVVEQQLADVLGAGGVDGGQGDGEAGRWCGCRTRRLGDFVVFQWKYGAVGCD